MSIADKFLTEFDQEMAATRRVIERAPDIDPDWKPHPKSFSIANLAQLLSWMPGWIGKTLTSSELDLAGGAGYSYERTETLLKMFDENVRTAREAIAASKEADYDAPWSLKLKGKALFTQPRGANRQRNDAEEHVSAHRDSIDAFREHVNHRAMCRPSSLLQLNRHSTHLCPKSPLTS